MVGIALRDQLDSVDTDVAGRAAAQEEQAPRVVAQLDAAQEPAHGRGADRLEHDAATGTPGAVVEDVAVLHVQLERDRVHRDLDAARAAGPEARDTAMVNLHRG